MTTLLEVGDRFPNVLIRREGATQALYNAASGNPVLLAWGASQETFAAVANDLAIECLQLGDADAGVVTDTDEGAPQLLVPRELKQRVIGPAPSGALLLEPSLRVLLRLDASEFDPVRISNALCDALAAARIGAQSSPCNHAPVLLVPRVLEPELIARVLAWFRDGGEGQESGVIVHERGEQLFRLDPGVKMRRESRVEDPALDAALHDRLMRRVLPEIARAFAFEVKQREAFKVLRYQAPRMIAAATGQDSTEGGGYFRAHRDNDARDVAHRRFAMTLNLNSGDYTGGRLRLPEFGPREYEAPTGGALLFSCSLLHEVTDLTAGTRYAMTSFFF